MALTVGITCYDGSKNKKLSDLLAHPDVQRAMSRHFATQEQRARANQKLARWVNHSAESYIPQWRKGQNKSFATANEMAVWLLYKSELVYRPSADTEKQLAEKINDCPGIRKTVAEVITQHIDPEFNRLGGGNKRLIGETTGRYATFYSKIFFKRNLSEGLAYFRNQRNPSLSEMAAFLGDMGLPARTVTKTSIIYTKGHDELRNNQAAIDDAEKRALEKLERGETDEQYRSLRQQLQNRSDHPDRRLQQLESEIKASSARLRDFLGKSPGLEAIQQDPVASKVFQAFQQQRRLANAAEAFELPAWKSRQQALFESARKTAENPTAKADDMFSTEMTNLANKLTESRDKQVGDAKREVKRINYNVAVDHQWTRFMMERKIAIGAGPSSTTAVTLGLVKHWCPPGPNIDKMYFAVAASLFAFWQRKKSLLRGFAAVHTWNEVMTALDNYLPRNSGYLAPLDWSASVEMQCKVYEYPDSFLKNGLPMFTNNCD